MTTLIPPCWSRAEIQVATQIDVGGLEFGDPVSDAIFKAVHQSVPLARLGKANTADLEQVSEQDVLRDLCQPLSSNEPHLRFITGKAGSGKSHLVRWLRTSIPDNASWQVIYIEKRNTSLRRVIEQILAGTDTPAATELRSSLARAASQLPTVNEAMLALLNHLHLLLEHDDTPEIDGMSGSDLIQFRSRVARLIGDYTFKNQLSQPGGPIERITKLAMSGVDADADITEDDLLIGESDLRVGIEAFIDTGEQFQGLIRAFVGSARMRQGAAAILNYHLPRAKAEVFTGRSSDLLEVFEEVRRELAARGKELFLFIEDLVLLHGIDTQLAQALTMPARTDLCPIRAVIAVTSGHLAKYTTFAERGVHYTMDLNRSSVDQEDLRTFVGRYLNAGRVGRKGLAAAAKKGSVIPNGCDGCIHRDRCHTAFGHTNAGHGLFPFNADAVDRMVQLASPEEFDPRNILRQVIRFPLEVAEEELPRGGEFPSARFAATLAPTRMAVPVEVRNAIGKRSTQPGQEVTLRAFYAHTPPAVDDDLRQIADILGVGLTDLGEDDVAPEPDIASAGPSTSRPHEIDLWVSGERLGSNSAQLIRRWVLNALAARLQASPNGVTVSRSGNDLRVGSVVVRLGNIVIPKASGGGGVVPDGPTLQFEANDSDGVLLKGLLTASSGTLAGPDGGRWFLEMQRRLARFENEIIAQAQPATEDGVTEALQVLGVLSTAADKTVDTPAEALTVLVRPKASTDVNPGIERFVSDTDRHRTHALAILRDRLTQRKGQGAPSVFDAAAVLGLLVPAARLQELPEMPKAPAELAADMRAFRDQHRAHARKMWEQVQAALAQIRRHVADDEDFAATAELMDKFVAHAHLATALSQRDAKAQYELARASVTPEAIRTHRRLLKLAPVDPGPAQLWDLMRDPMGELRALLDYWRLCDQLLGSVRMVGDEQASTLAEYDRSRLQSALRTLADGLGG
jgi:hypothetical protein